VVDSVRYPLPYSTQEYEINDILNSYNLEWIDWEYIKEQKSTISDYCKLNKISTLAENVLALFEKGETSLEEIYPYLIHEN
jgi:hypothetical protein